MSLRDVLVNFHVNVDQRQLVSAQQNVNKLISQFNGLARAAQFALGVLGVGKITDSADEYINMENKLKAVTDSTQEFVEAQRGVEKIADDLMQPVQDITDAYLRYSLATESLNVSQEEQLDFTKRVTQAMILSGATAEEAHRAAVQLAQGFGKNFKAAAQDLKSVKEQAPVLARIIEKAAGALPGQLLVAAKEGKVTSRLVFDAVREAGEDLDRDWAKRSKRFEDVSNLLGNQWMRLMKLLKPAFTVIISGLESVVHWIAEWVKDGSALNSVIAGSIVVVTALAYAMGSLALSAAAAAAPFLALFVVLEDLVGFLRGDDSFIGRRLEEAFGTAKVEEWRANLAKIIEDIRTVFRLISTEGGPELDMAAWRLERAFKGAIDRVWEYAKEKFRSLGDAFFDDKRTGPQKLTPEQQMQQQETADNNPVTQWFLDTLVGNAIREGRMKQGRDPVTGESLALPGGGLIGDAALPEPVYSPMPSYAGAPAAPVAPVINNNITVEGNADAATARDIATQTGTATSRALGRDATAVGAQFGVVP